MIGTYLPTLSNSSKELIQSLKEIKIEIMKAQELYKENFSFAICGDLNIDFRHGESRKTIFKDFIEDIKGVHFVPEFPSFQHYAWKTWSHLDGCIISQNIHIKTIDLVDEELRGGNQSDHIPVQIELNVPVKGKKIKKERTEPSKLYLHHKKINWEMTDKILYGMLSNSISNTIMESANADTPWGVKAKLFLDSLSSCAEFSEIKKVKKEKRENYRKDPEKKFKINKETKEIEA